MTKTLNSSQHKVFQELFVEERRHAGITHKTLAERLGVDRSPVTRIETGERRVDLVELQQICEVLGIPLVEFVRKYEERTRDEAQEDNGGTSK